MKMLVKSKSDAYGPSGAAPMRPWCARCAWFTGCCVLGSLTKVYVRYATDRDIKEFARRTKGMRVRVSWALLQYLTPHRHAGPRHMFGKRARKAKRPRPRREESQVDQEKQQERRKRQAESLDTALERYRSGAGADAAATASGEGNTDNGDAPAQQGPAKRRRGRGNAGSGSGRDVHSVALRSDQLEEIVGTEVLHGIEADRLAKQPKTKEQKQQSLDDALDAYLSRGSGSKDADAVTANKPAPAAATAAPAASASAAPASDEAADEAFFAGGDDGNAGGMTMDSAGSLLQQLSDGGEA